MNINNLDSKNFYTQRNNRIRPASACMPTARVMFYRGNNIPFKNKSGMANDDYFMSLLNTAEAKKYCLKKYPWSKNIPPNQVHGMYSTYLDEIVCGKKVSDFKVTLSYDEYISRIENGEIIMTSGAFPGLTGHAVCFIGRDQNEFLIADPWGNFRKNYNPYVAGDGYAVHMSYEEWIAMVKPVGEHKKWGHVII